MCAAKNEIFSSLICSTKLEHSDDLIQFLFPPIPTSTPYLAKNADFLTFIFPAQPSFLVTGKQFPFAFEF